MILQKIKSKNKLKTTTKENLTKFLDAENGGSNL
jgi:hypothetical protein